MSLIYQNYFVNGLVCLPYSFGLLSASHRARVLGGDHFCFCDINDLMDFRLLPDGERITAPPPRLVWPRTEGLSTAETLELDAVRKAAKECRIAPTVGKLQWFADAFSQLSEKTILSGDTPIVLLTILPNLLSLFSLHRPLFSACIPAKYQPAHSNNHRALQAVSLLLSLIPEHVALGKQAFSEAAKALREDGSLPLEDARGDKAHGYNRMCLEALRACAIMCPGHPANRKIHAAMLKWNAAFPNERLDSEISLEKRLYICAI